MIRFCLRDLFWATLAEAIWLGWSIHYQGTNAHRQAVIKYAEKLKAVLASAKAQCEQLERDVDFFADNASTDTHYLTVDHEAEWTVLNEPIPSRYSN